MADSRSALWASGHDESVEVNQRALIDKVLARYSGEFTVFRELLQNSDDAQSKAVEIHFETKAFIDGAETSAGEGDAGELPNLKTAHVHRWTFKNNGITFRDEDWSRLKKIAEGNPDEEKIGAFGVGFYSLFSVTEEPFVTSGDQWMGFYWKDKKDQLFARRGTLPQDSTVDRAWTSFEMVLREPSPIPVPFDFTRFLASSITFMTHLSEVSVYFDDKRLARLTKAAGIPQSLQIPRGMQTSSRNGAMTVNKIQTTPLHIKVEVMRWVYSSGTEKRKPIKELLLPKPGKVTGGGFFSSLFSLGTSTPQRAATPVPPPPPKEAVNLLAISETSVALSIFSADVSVKLDRKVAAELQRSTKKNPPSTLKYELIYTAKDEYDASKKEDEQQSFATGSVVQGLRADLDGTGSARIFIGHATGQTTGIGGHMAARFIPTVERESIDLMDRNVAIWNRELLFVGGFLARSAYELELANVNDLWEGSTAMNLNSPLPNDELQTWLRGRSIHALRFFTFHPSTPSSEVSLILEDAFFYSGGNLPFRLISNVGVRDAKEIRLPDPSFSTFLKQLPVLPEEVMANAQLMISSLRARKFINTITFNDVLKELRSRPLSVEEMVACLRWWIEINDTGRQADHIRDQLLSAAVLVIGKPGTPEERIVSLANVRTFITPKGPVGHIPQDGPLPESLLPNVISSKFTAQQLSTIFPWRELTIIEWINHICSPDAHKGDVSFDISVSATWAERVIATLARSWPNLSDKAKGEVAAILKTKTCIPTTTGMKIPDESYFENASIFPDLPVVTFPSGSMIKGQLERTLFGLGVRKHVELQIVFNRMIKTNEWTIAELTKYLVSVQKTLSPEEWSRLKLTPAFCREADRAGPKTAKTQRYKAKELYEPLDTFRILGLPVIDWGTQTKWKATSEEAKFLFELGLIRYPPLDEIIRLCASGDSQVRAEALKYFLQHITVKYRDYEPANFSHLAFIPAVKEDGISCLGNPLEVFAAPEWASFGFLVLAPNLAPDTAEKLKIKAYPPTSSIVSILEKTPPKSHDQAAKWFSTLASRIQDFTSDDLRRLGQAPIVPIKSAAQADNNSKNGLRWLPPLQCYFVGSANDKFHSKLFVFVDFGAAANGFLSACGTKNQPTVEEVAQILVQDPYTFYRLAESPGHFLAELRNIAVNSRRISSATLGKMKKSPILLGSQRRLTKPGPKSGSVEKTKDADEDEDEWDLVYDLKRPDQIVIADDTHAHQAFGEALFTAPQEDSLEAFYMELGSRRLSSLVKEEYQTAVEIKSSTLAPKTRKLILERLPLFLHEHTHAKTRVTLNWLTSETNFVVKSFGKISVVKTLVFGDLRQSHKQDASAVAKRVGSGPIQLWLADNSELDMYEVATALNRLIFDSPKANDALLFMTILSTDLRALKRRGYNIDRILRQQKADKEAQLHAMNQTLVSEKPPVVMPGTTTSDAVEVRDGRTSPTSRHRFQNLTRMFTGNAAGGNQPAEQGPPPLPPKPSLDTKPTPSATKTPKPAITQGNSQRSPLPNIGRSGGSHATPLSNIASNINMAISACRPEAKNLLQNREMMQQVKESVEEGYCDISGRVGDLKFVADMGGVKIFVSEEVEKGLEVIRAKTDDVARFIHIITALAQVYQLPLASLHIFYDLSGGLIAFNRNGSIFVNLRYFEEWHNEDVAKGNTQAAYTSWYFTLAHEIAHNLVHPHNSEHEFYFSAICEKYIMELGSLLSRSSVV